MEYNADKFEIVEHKQQQGAIMLTEVEKRCEKNHISFLKDIPTFEKIKDLESKPYFKECIAAMLLKVSNLSGLKGSLDAINVTDIVQMILITCKTLSIEEIYKAFQMERYSLYESKTEHFGLFNSDYVGQIIKKYKDWKLKEQREGNFSIQPKIELQEITESEKEEILIKGIVRVFDEFKETSEMPEPNNYIFDALYERKIIPDATTPEIQAYYQRKYSQASNEIHMELKASNVALTKNEKNEIQNELQKIIDNNSDKVAARVKKIILSEWFAKLIKNEKHISEFLS